EALSAGNVIVVMVKLGSAWRPGQTLGDILPELLRNYAIFHLLVTGLCAGWAVARLRALALKQTYGTTQKLPRYARVWGRPRVGLQPMIWKEIFAEPGIRLNWAGRILVAVLIILSFVPAGLIIYNYIDRGMARWADPLTMLRESMSIWCRM